MPDPTADKSTLIEPEPASSGFNIFGLTGFQCFKYAIYLLISYNLYLFILEEGSAAASAYAQGVTLSNFIEVYSATTDTAAWLVLLLIFELETATLSDERLKTWQGSALLGIKSICYCFILYAFYGYLSKFFSVTSLSNSPVNDACSLLGQGWSYVVSLNEYEPLNSEQCAALVGPLQQINNTQIIGNQEMMTLLRNLSSVDVINAGTWILVVAMLQVEVILQLKNSLSDKLIKINKIIKGFLYLILFAAAVYWWIDGSFLDFWDAFIWLVAFIFIDLNILEWQNETQNEQQEATITD